MEATSPTISIRLARDDDAPALRRLAALDSASPLRGPTLLAEVAGELRAARSLGDGRTVADPFFPSADLVALLELRAAQRREPRRARSHRRLAALRGATCSERPVPGNRRPGSRLPRASLLATGERSARGSGHHGRASCPPS